MIQIDMDMPKSCAVCRFNSRCDDCECSCNWCKAVDFKDDDDARIGCFNDGTREYDPEIGFTPEDHRMEWCPLEEVLYAEPERSGLTKRIKEVKSISYSDCANALVMMWLDEVLTDGEYYRIIDKLTEHEKKKDNAVQT